MTPEQIIFLLCAVLIVASAIFVVTSRNLVHAALWLVATLFGVAILYAMLQAGFIALVQVVVYIGAIAILFIFAVMLTQREQREKVQQLNGGWGWAGILAVVSFAGLAFILSSWQGFSSLPEALPKGGDPLTELGNALVSPQAFMLPFEVASILLLAALIGAVYVATAGKKK